ncbi:LLM class flavin-dependent oxidoreductase [Novosphingobium sp. PS1R-30]|uniref:LLM class flavin-dependent oxidoreductase n=1 Tax=Novosphingobium anseongense TaxID=3133436 RepID=A0ABU8RU14_9SPHN
MPVQFIGAIGSNGGSESRVSSRAVVDKVYLGAIARAHEAAGFDRVLVGYFSGAPDGFQVVAYAAQQTEKLAFLLAHRPGFVAPTLAARQLATLDHFSSGRLAVHIITGGSNAEQQRDGDFLTKEERYARTDEYLEVVRQSWTATEPFDHEGEHYHVVDSFSGVKPVQQPYLPVFFGGSSDAAIAVAGKHADVFALWGETLAQTAETIDRVREAAAKHGRENHIQFSLSLRPVLGRTEEEAWARADRILDAAKALRGTGRQFGRHDGSAPSVGSQRLLEAAAGGPVRDKRLWTEIAALTGAGGNSTGLVGTAEQVAESLLDYHDLGITNFLIRGFDPLEDAIEYGRDLIPLVRAAVAERDALPQAAE